jgi:hypothetical protein
MTESENQPLDTTESGTANVESTTVPEPITEKLPETLEAKKSAPEVQAPPKPKETPSEVDRTPRGQTLRSRLEQQTIDEIDKQETARFRKQVTEPLVLPEAAKPQPRTIEDEVDEKVMADLHTAAKKLQAETETPSGRKLSPLRGTPIIKPQTIQKKINR